MSLYKKVQIAAAFVRSQSTITPKVGIILGSGMGEVIEQMENKKIIPYETIPYFPVSTVEGHAGNLILARWNNVEVIAMQGRFHYYEGYEMEQITFPIRVMAALGAQILIIISAAGGIHPDLQVGTLLFVKDHVSFWLPSPLRGITEKDWGVSRFLDCTQLYDKALLTLAEATAKEQNIPYFVGIHTMVVGPQFETPAEIRLLRSWGIDSVGMSTIPETLVANHSGMKVLGVCLITDLLREEPEPISHEAVLKAAEQARPKLIRFLKHLLPKL